MSHQNWAYLPQGTRLQPPKGSRNLKLFTIILYQLSYLKKDIITDQFLTAFLQSSSKLGIRLAGPQIDKAVSRPYNPLETTQGL
jgi:hypothetical protein